MASKRGAAIVAVMVVIPVLALVLVLRSDDPPGTDDAGFQEGSADGGSETTPLARGSYVSTLIDGAVPSDTFVFEAEAGTLLWLHLDTRGSQRLQAELYGPDQLGADPPGEEDPFSRAASVSTAQKTPLLAYASGTWEVRITLAEDPTAGSSGLHPFELTYRFERPGSSVVHASSGPANAVEATWHEPTDLYLHVQFQVQGQDWRPDHAGILMEFDGALADQVDPGSFVIVQQDLDGRVLVGDQGLDLSQGDLDEAERHGDLLWYNWRAQLEDVTGSVRVSTFHEAGVASFRFLAVADAPPEWDAWSGRDTVRWEIGADGQRVITPLASVVPGDEYHLDVPDRFLGLVRLYEGQEGTYRTPDGTVAAAPELFSLRNPAVGAWDFTFDDYVEADQYQDRSFYGIAGAHLPSLGIFSGEGAQVPAA